jgi:hypothetical protein
MQFWVEGETLAEGFEKVKKIHAIDADARSSRTQTEKNQK